MRARTAHVGHAVRVLSWGRLALAGLGVVAFAARIESDSEALTRVRAEAAHVYPYTPIGTLLTIAP